MPDHDLDELIANLHSMDEELCRRSIERLGCSEDERALGPLIDAAVQTDNYNISCEAKDALEQLRQAPHIADLLIRKLTEDTSIERITLVASLLQRTADLHIAELLMAVSVKHSDNSELQVYATWAAIRCHRFSAREYWDAEKVKVLVVDDDPAVRDLLSLLLKSQGLSVLTAEDGLDGYEFAKICQPDVVLMDLMMPRFDGWQACKTIKEDETTQKIPIIILTALNSLDMVTALLDAGANEYLTKPSPSRVVVNTIKSTLQKSRLGIYDKTD